jgi:hypothetical protein
MRHLPYQGRAIALKTEPLGAYYPCFQVPFLALGPRARETNTPSNLAQPKLGTGRRERLPMGEQHGGYVTFAGIRFFLIPNGHT